MCVTIDHGYALLVESTLWSFPYSWLTTGFVTRVTRRVPIVEHELLTLPEHMSSTLVVSGDCVTRSLVLCVMFCRSVFDLFFGHCVVCTASICEFWWLLWYLQTLLKMYLLIVCCLMSSGKYFKYIQNENKINNIIKQNMKEKYDNQVKGHRLPLGNY